MKDIYFSYLCDLGLGQDVRYYEQLCKVLHDTDFQYILDMDENRIVDGLELRRAFFSENGINMEDSVNYATKPCSVLEMMIALAQRCCDTILEDGSGSDYTGEFFRLMLQNLGLLVWPDTHFNINKVDDILETFIDRKYEPDGKGGLFYIPDCRTDLRNVEIWNQAMWYLETILN